MKRLRASILMGIAAWLGRRPLPVLERLSRSLGRLAWVALPQRRRVTLRNLEACFPELDPPAREALARRTFASVAMGFLETFVGWYGDPGQWRGRVEIVGLEHLECPEGRGALLLTGHFACIELAGRMLNDAFREPAAMVVRGQQRNEHVEALVEARRTSHASESVPKKSVRRMLQILRSGGRLMYGPDQNFTTGAVFAPFFGVAAATPTATASLVERAGARVLPTWGIREPGPRYRIVIDAPWEDYPSGDPLTDATRLNAWIEDRVREAPDQYLWLHRKFRNRPDGEPPFYAAADRRSKHR